jgi:hypothetical protein
MVLHA